MPLPKHPDSARGPATSNASSGSNEADDERSWASPPTMAQRNARMGRQYEGEDTRPTSFKELRGFYAYSWASEVFVICGMGSFIPITIEQLARERGVLSTDPTVPCSKSMNHTSPGHSTSPSGPIATPQCVIHILGLEINTASFAMYTFSISVFVQFLLIISMSGAADHGSYRKSLLIIFATTGAIACMLFLPITPQVVLLGALLAIVANTCFGASSVLLNSFLPLLVRNHPDIRGPELDYSGATPESGTPEEDSTEHDSAPNQAAAPSNSGEDAHLADFSTPPITALDISTRISSIGVGIGYIAALIVQSIAIYVVRATGSTLSSLRLAIFIIGAWWLLFTIPGAMWLRPRPGPPLHISHSAGRVRTLLAYASYSWKSLGYSLMRARKLKDVLIFLAAWFLLSDAIATVTGTAVLFAKTTLGMSLGGLALINVVVTISGILGAFAWRHLADMMGLKPSHTVLLCILIFELVPLYGLLGYLPIFKQWGVGGLQQGWEMYPLSVVFGFVLGGLSSFCRSIFGELVPPGFETAFYSLYAITDKGSSIFGPAIVGAITDATGEIRPAFFFLAVLIAAPFPILMAVNTERGKRDGIALAMELAKADEDPDADEARLLGSGYDDTDEA